MSDHRQWEPRYTPTIGTHLSPEELKAVAKAVGELAERVALELDHNNMHHKPWYRAVKRARKILGITISQPHDPHHPDRAS